MLIVILYPFAQQLRNLSFQKVVSSVVTFSTEHIKPKKRFSEFTGDLVLLPDKQMEEQAVPIGV